jgi:hypothetical protein
MIHVFPTRRIPVLILTMSVATATQLVLVEVWVTLQANLQAQPITAMLMAQTRLDHTKLT